MLWYRDLDGQFHCLSKWLLSPEELEEVARTGVVWFNCWGPTHPPIWICGIDPFRSIDVALGDRRG